MYSARDKVFWFAILSRGIVFILQLAFNAICPDHAADAFHSPIDPIEKYNKLDKLIFFMFSGLTRWDAQYYVHIAKYGYTYENTLAFYPLYPILVKYTAYVLKIEPPLINYSNTIVISGFLINFVCFVKASLILYDLSLIVFKDIKIAYRAAILFCINPASIFFTALYTESMFAYLTFYTMLESIKNNPCVFLPLSLSSLVRSNGLINLGFPIYVWIRNLFVTSIPNCKNELKYYHSNKGSLFFNIRHIWISLIQIFVVVILSILPLHYLQIYNYEHFCKSDNNTSEVPSYVKEYAKNNNLLLIDEHEFTWCQSKPSMSLISSYSYIQSKYWDVGFLKYYKFKQIPNFLLASPILYIFLNCSYEFFKEHKSKFFTLQFFTGSDDNQKSEKNRYPLEIFVFIVHGLFLTIVCISIVHIQVSTRLLCSASPVIYWYCALATMKKVQLSKSTKQLEYESQDNMYSRWKVFFITQNEYSYKEKLIFGYFLGYTILGSFMFSNFLPWT
uniref:GPI mannosyltransferase 2 n=1 Tax=Trichogramma kaykai TaxID=54128 RepID=A0ABD2WVF4_9HYME